MSEEIKLTKISYAELQLKLIECNSDRIRLQQENQQLKEDVKDLDNQKQMMFKNMQLNQLKVCELAKVLDEIRELVSHFSGGQICECSKELGMQIEKILDKVKE